MCIRDSSKSEYLDNLNLYIDGNLIKKVESFIIVKAEEQQECSIRFYEVGV